MKRIPLSKITTDPRLQHRHLSFEYVNELLEAVDDGGRLPPVGVIQDGTTYWLFDGHHRFNVARIRKWDAIEADVYPGDFRAAWEASLGVNGDFGMRRTPKDIHGILSQVFADADLCKKSDAAIAKLVGCGKTTVFRFRHALDKAVGAASDIESTIDQLSQDSAPGGDAGAARTIKSKRKARHAVFELCLAVEDLGKFDELKDSLATIRATLNL